VLAVAGHSQVMDPGFGWHLESGRLISEGGYGLEDPFLSLIGQSETSPKKWVNNQWLSDYLIYQLFAAGGYSALTVISLTFLLLTYFVLPNAFIKKRGVSPFAASIVLSLTVFHGVVQAFVRPVIFSFFLFCVLHLYLLSCTRGPGLSKNTKPNYLFCFFLFVLWANLHPAFVFGWVLVGLFFVDTVFSARSFNKEVQSALALLVVCCIATLLNPYAYELHQAIAGLGGSKFFLNLNLEWLSVDLSSRLFLPLFVAMFSGLALVLAHGREQLGPPESDDSLSEDRSLGLSTYSSLCRDCGVLAVSFSFNAEFEPD